MNQRRPSFAANVDAWLSNDTCRCYLVNGKLATYCLLDRAGIPRAEVVRTLGRLAKLKARHLRRPVVIKPTDASSAIGVMNLSPSGPDVWLDRRSETELSFDDIVQRLTKQVLDRGYPDRWMLEEPLEPAAGRPALDDAKVYIFGGEPRLLLMRRSQPRRLRFRWFDLPEMTPDPPVGKHDGKIDRDIAAPENIETVLRMSRNVAQLVPRPFIRVDMLLSSLGPVVGEVNTHVGGAGNFTEEWDHHLGELWNRAEKDLLAHRCVKVPRRLAGEEWKFLRTKA